MCAQLADERRRRALLKSPTNYLSVRILLHLCPHATICVPSYILLYVRPHTITYLPSYYYMCVLILLLYVSSYYYMCPHTALCVLILTSLFLLPLRYVIVVHSTRLASLKNFDYYIFKKNFNYYTIVCVLILLYKCPHNTIYMSAYCYVSSY